MRDRPHQDGLRQQSQAFPVVDRHNAAVADSQVLHAPIDMANHRPAGGRSESIAGMLRKVIDPLSPGSCPLEVESQIMWLRPERIRCDQPEGAGIDGPNELLA